MLFKAVEQVPLIVFSIGTVLNSDAGLLMTFVWSYGPTGLPHTVRIFWRLECWPLVQPRSARKQTRRLRASAYGNDFGYAAIACFRQPSLRLSSARVAGLQSGGSYKATPAQLPPGASMGAFVASRKRPSRNSRHNAGAMMASQSCGLSVAHPCDPEGS